MIVYEVKFDEAVKPTMLQPASHSATFQMRSALVEGRVMSHPFAFSSHQPVFEATSGEPPLPDYLVTDEDKETYKQILAKLPSFEELAVLEIKPSQEWLEQRSQK
jgi:hypothetical protein